MKYVCISIAAAMLLGACAASRKTPARTEPATGTVMPPMPVRPANGIYAPGDAELQALRASGESSATLETLTEGYTLYTGDACTKCHSPKSIASRPVASWPGIISNMAGRARLSDSQKDAVLKYVLSIKAAQGK